MQIRKLNLAWIQIPITVIRVRPYVIQLKNSKTNKYFGI